MTAQQDETQDGAPSGTDAGNERSEQTGAGSERSGSGAQAPSQDTRERFRAALEAKRAGQRGGGAGARERDALAGHAKDGAHGHKVFRRKSG